MRAKLIAALGLLATAVAVPARSETLPPGYAYVVAPARISPEVGSFPPVKPWFREPYLLVTDAGMVTAFMEIPPTDSAHRLGWSCFSADGTGWQCGRVDSGPLSTDFADAWIADTRGDACPVNGAGLTMAALRDSPTNVLEPIFYTSQDMGRTWSGPTRLSWPPGILADGTKIVSNGRTYIGWRDFTFGTGAYVSRLGTDNDPCAWTEPVRVLDGQDHLRMAEAPEQAGFAVRGGVGLSVLTFHRFGPDFAERQASVVGAVSPVYPIYRFCDSKLACRTAYDISRTLLYDPSADRYHLVFSDRPDPLNQTDVVTRYTHSDDGGATWAAPVTVAGDAPGAASMEAALARDPVTGRIVLGYYEKPSRDSTVANLRIRVLRSDGVFDPPVTVDVTTWVAPSTTEKRWGDYFGLQARGGIVHIVHHPIDAEGNGYIAYLSVRYPA
jgi:hypothetical protein